MSSLLSPDAAPVVLEPAAATGRLTAVVPCDPAVDTSAELAAAIRHVAPLLQDQRLVVTAMWRSIAPAAGLARAALPPGVAGVGARNWDAEQRERARRCAERGAAVAAECGVEATAETRRVDAGWAASAATIAAEHGADVIVLARAPGGPAARAGAGRRLTGGAHRSGDRRSSIAVATPVRPDGRW